MNNKVTKYRSSNIKVVKFHIGDNHYDKTTVYYRNGQIKQEKNYKNGKLSGNLISYWDNGLIHIKGKYKKNERIGVWRTFNKKGRLVLSENHLEGKFISIEDY